MDKCDVVVTQRYGQPCKPNMVPILICTRAQLLSKRHQTCALTTSQWLGAIPSCVCSAIWSMSSTSFPLPLTSTELPTIYTRTHLHSLRESTYLVSPFLNTVVWIPVPRSARLLFKLWSSMYAKHWCSTALPLPNIRPLTPELCSSGVST